LCCFFSSKLAAVLRKLHNASAADSTNCSPFAANSSSKQTELSVGEGSPKQEPVNAVSLPQDQNRQLDLPGNEDSPNEQPASAVVDNSEVKCEPGSIDKVNKYILSRALYDL
jgi:hypothetical protein